MKKVPFHKKQWFVGTKIQKDLMVYIICLSLLSQLLAIVYIAAEDIFLINDSYLQPLKIIVNVIFFGYVLYGFWLSNRIAGPLFRFARHMHEMANGEIDTEIQFRKNDYGSELAEAFNEVIKKRINPNNQQD